MQLLTVENYTLAGRYGMWHPDGWYLLVNGQRGSLPPDLEPLGFGGFQVSEALDIWLQPYDHGFAGGHIYWNVSRGRAEVYDRNHTPVGGVNGTWVGAFRIWPGAGAGGWSVGANVAGTYAYGTRRLIRVLAFPWGGNDGQFPAWFGNWPGTNIPCGVPWWSGKIYREGPPAQKGAPVKP